MNTQTLTIIVLIVIAITSVIPSLLQAMGARRNQKEMQEQMKKREEYLANLKKGDEVILLDGIHGKIVSIKGTLVELKISQNTVVYVEKESIMGKSRELLFK
ncbi:preprotein translocase subunit YajC [Enterococcus cecorum]|uniref:preprotein translocase subunit YajC n=1 Tax=Enterococcus cecorum TaxID=44008 RepID=UPI000B0D0398|nr:preprotein translocase subunit YajC [Enterococcus cecorum]MCJ0554183.1 preprotein translocase subunit YajC [Enterococcus cecorum]MCJ0557494.1 preprotein translocase subunit YajC [Enterococcus cecorum]MCJ0561949.1 preprotein translocase subunit YajC [Enterococcus cecorum]MCJ0563981.1 preprotein translocase subunit YajC [Enterococcus cecorum]MCJ0567171.1 preprotein translocase subunit YajC [Enterococcus cecorum]